MKAKKYIKSASTMFAIKKYFNVKVIASIVASLMLLYTLVALYNYTKENGTLLYNVAEAQITSTVPIVKGEIKTQAEVEQTSSYSVDNGFDSINDTYSDSSSSSNSSNTSSQNNRPSSTPTSNNLSSNNQAGSVQNNNEVAKDMSFLKGTSITMVEGDVFNPITNLGIVAHDKDGTDITNRVSIDENTVDVNNEGSYYVKTSVKLNDGSTLEKVFTVKVNPKKEVTYEVNNFEMLENTAPKLGTVRIFFDSNVSDDTVSPVKATVNGIEYNVNNFGKSGFGKSTRHYIDVNVGDISGEFKLNVEKIEFSNGVSVWPNKQMNVYVIKSEPVVSNFSYTEDEEGKIYTTFDLKDLDNSLSNIKASLYNEKGILVEEYKVAKKEKYSLDFNVEANGKYTLEVIGDVNLYDDLSRLNQNRVILSENIQVSNIIDKSETPIVDKSKLEANDIEISIGQELNIDDLNIMALDTNGEDISSEVEIDTSALDINTTGEYKVLLTVINSDDVKLEKVVNVTVSDNGVCITDTTSKPLNLGEKSSRIIDKNEPYSVDDTYVKKSRSVQTNTALGNDGTPLDTNVTMMGSVSTDNGTASAGRIEVELPSSMNFMVDKLGNFTTASNYSIENRSNCNIDVFVTGFAESSPDDGIFIKEDDVQDTEARNNVNLKLSGNAGHTKLHSKINSEIKIANIKSTERILLTLEGKAGKSTTSTIDDKGVSENFTIIFRINKA